MAHAGLVIMPFILSCLQQAHRENRGLLVHRPHKRIIFFRALAYASKVDGGVPLENMQIFPYKLGVFVFFSKVKCLPLKNKSSIFIFRVHDPTLVCAECAAHLIGTKDNHTPLGRFSKSCFEAYPPRGLELDQQIEYDDNKSWRKAFSKKFSIFLSFTTELSSVIKKRTGKMPRKLSVRKKRIAIAIRFLKMS